MSEVRLPVTRSLREKCALPQTSAKSVNPTLKICLLYVLLSSAMTEESCLDEKRGGGKCRRAVKPSAETKQRTLVRRRPVIGTLATWKIARVTEFAFFASFHTVNRFT